MKKLITLINLLALCVTTLFAQAPEKFTYQAVVRNASNQLVANAPVGVRISLLQGGVNGTLVYMETQTSPTNANGLMTLSIGGGTLLHGDFASIDWANGPYFLKTEIDPTGGTDYSVTSTQQLLSVPYALYSKEAGNGFSGDYNDLTNKPELFSGDYNDLVNPPTIPTVPTNVSAFNNDAGYITMDSVPAIPTNVSNFTNDAGYITSADIPAIPTVPTNVGAFTNDAGYLTGYTETDPQFNAWDKDYNDLTNKPNLFSGDYNDLTNPPTIPTVPTNVSAFVNDAGYITMDSVPTIPTVPVDISAFNNDAGYITSADIPSQVNADWNATTGVAEILNKPTIPTIPANMSAFNNDLGYITASSIPANVSAFNNDVGYVTAAQIPAQVNADWNAMTGAAQILNKPTNVSTFTNDAGYITSASIPSNVSAFTNDAGYITSANVPTVPANVSAFNNDAGYITTAQIPAQVNADWNATSGAAQILNKPNLFSGNYNDLTDRPTIPTVPTNVSAFNNDAGYITSADIPEISNVPTNVSAFTNDAGYITAADVPAQVNADWNATSGAAQILNKPTLFSGNYNDLTNKPTIPTVPTNVGAFTNDAHYITEAQLNAWMAAVNNTIDSLRDRIEELENGESPVNPNPVNSDTTFPIIPNIVDGQACPGRETVYDYDGNPYPTVVIGQQCWMKTNLRTTHYSDGTNIDLSTSTSGTTPRRYYPYYYSDNINTYGYVYNWYAVMNGNASSNSNPSPVQGICPIGWHVPSNSEWSQLTNYVNTFSGFQCGSTDYNIAKALSSTSGWLSSSSVSCAVGYNPSLNNATGFSALPAGNQTYYSEAGTFAYFWSCTQSNSGSAYGITLQYNSPTVGVSADCYMSGFRSVRCVCDSTITGGGSQAVVTGFVSSVTSTTAQCSGSVVTDYGYAVTERGVCWSTSHNPTIYHNRTVDGAGMGSFISNLTGLTPGTVYYVRAYAITNAGVIYGGEVQFTTQIFCGTSTVKDYDQNVYHTVQIGDQCWMKENLRSTHYADGTAISSGNGNGATTTTAYYYTLSNQSSIQYGYLYNWKAVLRNSSSSMANPSGVQGICPTGWHVPSDAEWAALEEFLSMSDNDSCWCSNNSSYIAKSLAYNSEWTTNTNTCVVGNGQNNNNVTGFSALPAGYHRSYSNYYNFSTSAVFWSSTQASSGYAWCRELDYNSAIVNRIYYDTTNGNSVRCLRD